MLTASQPDLNPANETSYEPSRCSDAQQSLPGACCHIRQMSVLVAVLVDVDRAGVDACLPVRSDTSVDAGRPQALWTPLLMWSCPLS